MELNAKQRMTLMHLSLEHTSGYTDGNQLAAKGSELAHLLERGLIVKASMHSHYRITETGRKEINPKYQSPAETLRAEIAALERQLADKRAALGAVETGENSLV